MKRSDWMVLKECIGWLMAGVAAMGCSMLKYHIAMWIVILIFLALLARCVHKITTNHPDIQKIHEQSIREYWKTKEI